MKNIKYKKNGFFSSNLELFLILSFVLFSATIIYFVADKVLLQRNTIEYTLKTFEDSYSDEDILEKTNNIIFKKEILSNNLKELKYSNLIPKECFFIVNNIPDEKIPQIREIKFNNVLAEGNKNVILVDSNEERKIAIISNIYTPEDLEDISKNCVNSDISTLSFIIEDKF